jgi:hypothetical protein
MEHGTTWVMVASGVSTVAGLAVQIALLAVTLTVVRRNKPRAVTPLATSFGIGIASTALSVVVYPLVGVVASRSGGIDSYMLVQSAVTVGFTLVHVVSGVLLVLGLVNLATPEPGREMDPSAPRY